MNLARGLTDAEISMARTVFRHGIDYAAVRLYAGAWWLRTPHMAVVPGNRVYFPPAHCLPDFACAPSVYQAWLVHELAHVWQHQHGFPLWFGAGLMALRGAYVRRRGYRYLPLARIRTLACLNMEQQADVLAHYFLARHHRHPQYGAQLPHYRRLLRPLWADPHNTGLLPHY